MSALPTVETCLGLDHIVLDRLGRARVAMAAADIDALLITGEQDIRYLAGCNGHDVKLLVTEASVSLISDRRYEEYLAPWQETGHFHVEIPAGRAAQLEWIGTHLAEAGIGRLHVQADHTTLTAQEGLAKAIPSLVIEATTAICGPLRMQKSPDEIEAIERAIGVQTQALHAMLADLRLGMTEGQAAARLIYEMRIRGAESESFEPIVGSGANASIIHHMPGASPIVPGVLLVDWGARVDGLCSDLTRTFFLGEPPEELGKVYNIVNEARLAAIAACHVGTPVHDVDAAARNVIEAAGYGEQFAHGVGHGLGRDVHEQPFMGRAAPDVALLEGMVVTIEPGIYLPGLGGVRLEDDVLVTDGDPRVLSADLETSFESACLALPKKDKP